jgi:carbonic anhydrase
MATQAPSAEYARILAENERYAAQFDHSALPLPPGRKLAVLACMDARLTVEDVLGLRTGDAHIIRNAGGLATDDAIRSLVISQNLLGTEEVIVIEHTGAGCSRSRTTRSTATWSSRPGATWTSRSTPSRPRVEPARAGSTDPRSPVDQGRAGPRLVYEVETGRLREVA